MARICKWLQRQLASDLPLALSMTRTLRRHRQQHVRLFAAQAVAFLLRAAPDAAIPAGIAALFEEATASTAVVIVKKGSLPSAADGEEHREEKEEEVDVEEDDKEMAATGLVIADVEEVRDINDREIENNVDGAGALLSEALKGAAHGLHSRAPRLLSRILRPRLTRSEDDDDAEAAVKLGRAYDVAAKAVDGRDGWAVLGPS